MLLCKVALVALSLWGIGAAVIVSAKCGPENLWHLQGDATCNGDVSAPCFVHTCTLLIIAVDEMADRHHPRWCYRGSYVHYCGLVSQPVADDRQEKVRSMRCLCLETCVSIALVCTIYLLTLMQACRRGGFPLPLLLPCSPFCQHGCRNLQFRYLGTSQYMLLSTINHLALQQSLHQQL